MTPRLHRGMLTGLCLLLALGGCEDSKARRQADEQIANLRRERDEYLAQRDQAREDREKARQALVDKYGNALADAQQQSETFGRQLDRIRDAVNAAMSADGRVARLADSNRDHIVELVNEFIIRFHSLREQNRAIDAKCQSLTKDVDALTESLRKAVSPPATSASQPDQLDLMPRQ